VVRSPKSVEQRQRLAAALRENLKRRKARERALAAEEPPDGAGEEAGPHRNKAGKAD